MPNYARKPNVVEAVRWSKESNETYPEWVFEALCEGSKLTMDKRDLLYNGEPVNDGDYIVKESDGVSVRHGQTFEQNYYPLL